jgi:hypothetical protein
MRTCKWSNSPPRPRDSLHLLSVSCGPTAAQEPGTRTFMQVSRHAKSVLRHLIPAPRLGCLSRSLRDVIRMEYAGAPSV